MKKYFVSVIETHKRKLIKRYFVFVFETNKCFKNFNSLKKGRGQEPHGQKPQGDKNLWFLALYSYVKIN